MLQHYIQSEHFLNGVSDRNFDFVTSCVDVACT